MFPQITSNIKQALSSLRTSKLRTALTMIGMIIGVGSVILLLAAGKGAQQLILNQVADLGSNVVYLYAGGDGGERRGPPAAVRGVVTKSMKMRDAEMLRRNASSLGINNVSTATGGTAAQFKQSGKEEVVVGVQARDRYYFAIRKLEFAEGRIWSQEDEMSMKRVAVLGKGAKEDIFGQQMKSAVGQRIKIKEQTFTVVGVLEDKDSGIGGVFGQSDADSIIIPTQTSQQYLLGIDYISSIMFEVNEGQDTEQVIARVEKMMRSNHKLREDEENDFSVRTQQDIVDVISTITGVFTLFLASIAAISLIVGGIGIMNIMLVVVSERTKEIGLRKAIGAKRRDLLTQFLIESLVITLFGGIIGIIIGMVGSFALSIVGGWDFTIDVESIALAVGVSAFFGIVFGLYPANKASKMDPIEALRYE